MRDVVNRRWGPIALAIAMLFLTAPARAAITPQSDIVMTYFEVDVTRHDVGLTTQLSVVNATPKDVRTRLTIYTNWGIPVLEVPLDFDRTQVHSLDLHMWIADGILPDRRLTDAELADLQARLTGKPSPVDGLYYSTAVESGVAVGYVVVSTLGDRPDALWGDHYHVNLADNFFDGETLQSLTHDLKADCDHHGIRFSNEGRLIEGTTLVIWNGRRFQPSPTPNPIGTKMNIKVAIYDQAGNHVHDCYRALLPVDTIQVCHLEGLPPIGWLEIFSDDPTFVQEHLDSTTLASAELHSYCLVQAASIEGPGITLEKKINEFEADVPDGPRIEVGNPIEYQFYVTNSGTVPLSAVRVVDDDVKLQIECPKATLDPGETMICRAPSISAACLNINSATASGMAASGTRVTATDVAHYFGVLKPAISVELLVNGQEADTETGPTVDADETLHWTYLVTNTGNTRLKNVSASNSKGVRADCPKAELEAGESMTCTATSLALEGQQFEIATARGSDACETDAKATDPAYYFGRANKPSIHIEKYVGENDADTPPGPSIPVGTTIVWRYVVTNTGNVPVFDIVVTDDDGVTPQCPKTALEPGESMICTASSIAVACDHRNLATATGKVGEGNRHVSAEDPANYFGQGAPAIALELKLNGDPADTSPGNWIDEGAPLDLAFEVTNTGNVALTGIVVTDEFDHTVACPKTTLLPGESMTCTASGGVAVAGMHEILGTASGNPPCGDPVTANDPAFYRTRVPNPGISIVKKTNGSDGPKIHVGSVVEWSYEVTNTGNVALSNIVVTDDHEVAIKCPKSSLEPGESMTCTTIGLAQPCEYRNTGTVTGQPPEGRPISASDTSSYIGEFKAAMTLVKRVNGHDVVEPPGPPFTLGQTLDWTFEITNTGEVALTEVTVNDDRVGAVDCPKTTLQPGESMSCHADGAALVGPQINIATATGKPPCGDLVRVSDTSWYTGVNPSIAIEKLVNGKDADDANSAVKVSIESKVLFSYVVTNTGDVPLDTVSVTDDKGLTVTCPKTTLAVGEAMTCTAETFAASGLNCNIGSVSADSPQDVTVSATDPACYEGLQVPTISIVKKTNGEDANTPTGPILRVGDSVAWTYLVTNTSTVALTGIVVTDDKGVTVTCPKTALEPGETMTCTASGTAAAGQYANVGTVTGNPPEGSPVTASDPSHYFGIRPAIDIEKLTNSIDADTPPGPTILGGATVSWTYVVTNTGDAKLTGVTVTDDKGVTVTCPKTALDPGESMTCTASGTADLGQYANVGTATGTPPSGPAVTDTDPSHYFGVNPAIGIEKATNGFDADSPPGPEITVGGAVQWTYIVTNTGTVTVTNVTVTDNRGVTVTCPKTTLTPGESMTCTASGIATLGQYSNVGTVIAVAPVGPNLSASDPSHYLGKAPPSQGCTPGYWKNHTDSWPPTGYSTSQKVKNVFTEAWRYPGGWASLHDALGFGGGSGVNGAAEILLRAAVAALLNASHPDVNYPRTEAAVIADVNAALASYDRDTMLALAAALDADNNLGCPLN